MDLERFINYVNGFHHALKFTWEISETCVSFLDISVSINGDALATSVSYKPTDSHSYLLFSSSHPNHTKQSIPYSQFLRLRRLCSDDKDFETKSLEMRTFFVERGYPTHLLDSAIQKAFNNSRRDTLKPPLAKISDDKIPLVLTFHPFNYKVREVKSRSCSKCCKLYIGETGRRLSDRFAEHLRSVRNNDVDKPVARHFNAANHSISNMKICAISPISGGNESRKRHEKRLIFKIGTIHPHGLNERFSFI